MTDQPTSALDRALDLIDEALAPRDWPEGETGASAVEIAEARDALASEAFRIDGERTALWAIGKYRRAQARIAEAEETAAELRRMADEHVARAHAAEEQTIRYFTGLLRQYLAELRAVEPKKKSRTLPDGTKLAEKVGSVAAVYVDEHGQPIDTSTPEGALAKIEAVRRVVAWLEDHADEVPDGVRYPDPEPVLARIADAGGKAKVDKEQPGVYPAAVADTGEVVDGLAYRRGEPTFDIVLADLDPEG